MAKYKDSHNLIYRTVKKNDKYYLLIQLRNSTTKQHEYVVEVEGKENIFKYIKSNGLRRVESSNEITK